MRLGRLQSPDTASSPAPTAQWNAYPASRQTGRRDLPTGDFGIELHPLGRILRGRTRFLQLNVDMKAASLRQLQTPCPFRSARQKIFGLGYHLRVCVYEKEDDIDSQSARLDLRHTIFVGKPRTADFQTT